MRPSSAWAAIGMIAVMALHAAGCASIVAVDVEPEKLAAARGAIRCQTEHVRMRATRIQVAAIRALTGGPSAWTAPSDAAGTNPHDRAGLRGGCANSVDQCVFASHPASGERIYRFDPHDLISGKSLRGSLGRGEPARHRRAALRRPSIVTERLAGRSPGRQALHPGRGQSGAGGSGVGQGDAGR